MHKGRLEAFSDGVLAIIITIMALQLRTPLGGAGPSPAAWPAYAVGGACLQAIILCKSTFSEIGWDASPASRLLQPPANRLVR